MCDVATLTSSALAAPSSAVAVPSSAPSSNQPGASGVQNIAGSQGEGGGGRASALETVASIQKAAEISARGLRGSNQDPKMHKSQDSRRDAEDAAQRRNKEENGSGFFSSLFGWGSSTPAEPPGEQEQDSSNSSTGQQATDGNDGAEKGSDIFSQFEAVLGQELGTAAPERSLSSDREPLAVDASIGAGSTLDDDGVRYRQFDHLWQDHDEPALDAVDSEPLTNGVSSGTHGVPGPAAAAAAAAAATAPVTHPTQSGPTIPAAIAVPPPPPAAASPAVTKRDEEIESSPQPQLPSSSSDANASNAATFQSPPPKNTSVTGDIPSATVITTPVPLAKDSTLAGPLSTANGAVEVSPAAAVHGDIPVEREPEISLSQATPPLPLSSGGNRGSQVAGSAAAAHSNDQLASLELEELRLMAQRDQQTIQMLEAKLSQLVLSQKQEYVARSAARVGLSRQMEAVVAKMHSSQQAEQALRARFAALTAEHDASSKSLHSYQQTVHSLREELAELRAGQAGDFQDVVQLRTQLSTLQQQFQAASADAEDAKRLYQQQVAQNEQLALEKSDLADKAETARSQATAAQRRAVEAEAELDALTSRLQDESNRFAASQKQMNDQLQQQQTAFKTREDELLNTIAEKTRQVESLEAAQQQNAGAVDQQQADEQLRSQQATFQTREQELLDVIKQKTELAESLEASRQEALHAVPKLSEQLQSIRGDLESAKQEIAVLSTARDELATQLQTSQTRVQELQEASSRNVSSEVVSELQEQLQTASQAVSQTKQQVADLQSELADVQSAATKHEAEASHAKIIAEERQNYAANVEAELAAARALIASATQADGSVVSVGELKTLQSKLEYLEGVNGDLENDLDEAQNELEQMSNSKESLQASLEQMRAQLDSGAAAVNAELQAALQAKNDLEARVRNFEKEKREAVEDYTELQRSVESEKLQFRQELAVKAQQIQELQSSINSQQNESTAQISALQSQISAADVQIADLSSRSKQLSSTVDQLQASLDQKATECTAAAADRDQALQSAHALKMKIQNLELESGRLRTQAERHEAELIKKGEQLEQAISARQDALQQVFAAHQARDAMSSQLADKTQQLQQLQVSMQQQQSSHADSAALKGRIIELEAQVAAQAKELAPMNKMKSHLEKLIKALKATRAAKDDLEKSNAEFQSRISELQSNAEESAAELQQLRAQCAAADSQRLSYGQQEQLINQQLQQMTGECDRLQEELHLERATAQQQADQFAQDRARFADAESNFRMKLHNETSSLSGQVSSLQSQLENAQTQLAAAQEAESKALADAQSRNDQAAQTQNDLHAEIARLASQLQDADNDHTSTRHALDTAENSLKLAQAEIQRLNGFVDVAEQHSTQASSLESQLASMKGHADNLSTQCLQLQEELDRTKSALSASVQEHEATRAQLATTEKNYSSISDNLQEALDTMSSTDARLVAAQDRAQHLDAELQRQSSQYDEAQLDAQRWQQELHEQIAQLEQEREAHNAAQQSMSDELDSVRAKIVDMQEEAQVSAAHKSSLSSEVESLRASVRRYREQLEEAQQKAASGAASHQDTPPVSGGSVSSRGPPLPSPAGDGPETQDPVALQLVNEKLRHKFALLLDRYKTTALALRDAKAQLAAAGESPAANKSTVESVGSDSGLQQTIVELSRKLEESEDARMLAEAAVEDAEAGRQRAETLLEQAQSQFQSVPSGVDVEQLQHQLAEAARERRQEAERHQHSLEQLQTELEAALQAGAESQEALLTAESSLQELQKEKLALEQTAAQQQVEADLLQSQLQQVQVQQEEQLAHLREQMEVAVDAEPTEPGKQAPSRDQDAGTVDNEDDVLDVEDLPELTLEDDLILGADSPLTIEQEDIVDDSVDVPPAASAAAAAAAAASAKASVESANPESTGLEAAAAPEEVGMVPVVAIEQPAEVEEVPATLPSVQELQDTIDQYLALIQERDQIIDDLQVNVQQWEDYYQQQQDLQQQLADDQAAQSQLSEPVEGESAIPGDSGIEEAATPTDPEPAVSDDQSPAHDDAAAPAAAAASAAVDAVPGQGDDTPPDPASAIPLAETSQVIASSKVEIEGAPAEVTISESRMAELEKNAAMASCLKSEVDACRDGLRERDQYIQKLAARLKLFKQVVEAQEDGDESNGKGSQGEESNEDEQAQKSKGFFGRIFGGKKEKEKDPYEGKVWTGSEWRDEAEYDAPEKPPLPRLDLLPQLPAPPAAVPPSETFGSSSSLVDSSDGESKQDGNDDNSSAAAGSRSSPLSITESLGLPRASPGMPPASNRFSRFQSPAAHGSVTSRYGSGLGDEFGFSSPSTVSGLMSPRANDGGDQGDSAEDNGGMSASPFVPSFPQPSPPALSGTPKNSGRVFFDSAMPIPGTFAPAASEPFQMPAAFGGGASTEDTSSADLPAATVPESAEAAFSSVEAVPSETIPSDVSAETDAKTDVAASQVFDSPDQSANEQPASADATASADAAANIGLRNMQERMDGRSINDVLDELDDAYDTIAQLKQQLGGSADGAGLAASEAVPGVVSATPVPVVVSEDMPLESPELSLHPSHEQDQNPIAGQDEPAVAEDPSAAAEVHDQDDGEQPIDDEAVRAELLAQAREAIDQVPADDLREHAAQLHVDLQILQQNNDYLMENDQLWRQRDAEWLQREQEWTTSHEEFEAQLQQYADREQELAARLAHAEKNGGAAADTEVQSNADATASGAGAAEAEQEAEIEVSSDADEPDDFDDQDEGQLIGTIRKLRRQLMKSKKHVSILKRRVQRLETQRDSLQQEAHALKANAGGTGNDDRATESNGSQQELLRFKMNAKQEQQQLMNQLSSARQQLRDVEAHRDELLARIDDPNRSADASGAGAPPADKAGTGADQGQTMALKRKVMELEQQLRQRPRLLNGEGLAPSDASPAPQQSQLEDVIIPARSGCLLSCNFFFIFSVVLVFAALICVVVFGQHLPVGGLAGPAGLNGLDSQLRDIGVRIGLHGFTAPDLGETFNMLFAAAGAPAAAGAGAGVGAGAAAAGVPPPLL